jgi:hypothetical protein
MVQVKTVNISQEIVPSRKVETPSQIRKTGIAYPGCSRSEVVFIGEEKSHIKYEENDQLWCELLADDFYRILRISVAETRPVEINGKLVRASSWIEGHIPTKDEFVRKINNGFIADCLLANWDIVAKLNNSIIEDKTKELYRTDNGGTLLFRACGTRKENFDGIVAELESTRHSYPLLNEEEIREQVFALKAKLTNEVIESKVDSVPLSKQDSNYLKTILKQRGDFIIDYYNRDPNYPNEIPKIGIKLEEVLLRNVISDEKLSEIIPEWQILISESGYTHEKLLLSDLIKDEINSLKKQTMFLEADPRQRNLLLIATLFHRMGEPIGTVNELVVEDPYYKEWSAYFATRHMMKWGYSRNDITFVNSFILTKLED